MTKAANWQVELDRKRFVAVKRREYNAIMPNSSMLQLAGNFCLTQWLEKFATARIAAIASSSNNGSSNNTLLFASSTCGKGSWCFPWRRSHASPGILPTATKTPACA
jgi:hypothetical protein